MTHKPKGRGEAAQRERRELERSSRRRALVFAYWANLQGLSWHQAARRIGLSARTLGNWEAMRRMKNLVPLPLGRKPDLATNEDKKLVLALFDLMGTSVGVPTLQALVPTLLRREIEELARCYKVEALQKKRYSLKVLTWKKAGTVWAADFTGPPTPIDGIYTTILAVRDLASGASLAALPCDTQSSREVVDLLRSLFLEHGAPLVLKTDNGSVFTADETREFLASHQVTHLLSPPGYPAYNGACEAGIGALKTRAHHLAARHGRAGHWSTNDVEGARLMANETMRNRGAVSPTPDQRWAARTALLAEERERFLARVADFRVQETGQETNLPGLAAQPKNAVAIERIAIARALVARDYLQYRRRRIPLPITPQFRANIS